MKKFTFSQELIKKLFGRENIVKVILFSKTLYKINIHPVIYLN